MVDIHGWHSWYSISVITIYTLLWYYNKSCWKKWWSDVYEHYFLEACNGRHVTWLAQCITFHLSTLYIVIIQQKYLKEMVKWCKHYLLEACKVSERNMVKCCQHYLLEVCDSQLLGDPAMGHGCWSNLDMAKERLAKLIFVAPVGDLGDLSKARSCQLC